MIVLLPAHNEQDCLPATIESLNKQTVVPDNIVVISDNSTDNTVQVGEQCGATVIETVGNTHKKAGALNYALENMPIDDHVLIMDADTQLVPDFIERALREFNDPEVGAVGAVFSADRRDSYVRYCQALEWERYAEQIGRTGKVFVLSGTAAIFRPEALKSVKQKFGYFYNTNSMTEDSAMTIQMKMCGWRLKSPIKCKTTTETMPSFKTLITQRTRWTLGAMQNIKLFGVNKTTLPYLWQQIMLGLSVSLMSLMIFSTVLSSVFFGFKFSWFWLIVGLVFVVERVVTVQGFKNRLFAGIMVPELVYALVLQWCYVKALKSFIMNKQVAWHSAGV